MLPGLVLLHLTNISQKRNVTIKIVANTNGARFLAFTGSLIFIRFFWVSISVIAKFIKAEQLQLKKID